MTYGMDASGNITAKKGDTFNGASFAYTINTTAANITSARFAIATSAGKAPVLELLSPTGLTVSSGTVTLEPQVFNFKAGTYIYELEITLANGYVKTWMGANFTLLNEVID